MTQRRSASNPGRDPKELHVALLGIALSSAYLLYFLLIQPPITFADGRGWDGRFLFAMAESGLRIPVPPHQLRILVPLLAASMPFDDLLLGFKVLNLTIGLLAAIATWQLLRRLYDRQLGASALIVCWLLIVGTQTSPIPESAWHPAQTDALTNFLLLGVLFVG